MQEVVEKEEAKGAPKALEMVDLKETATLKKVVMELRVIIETLKEALEVVALEAVLALQVFRLILT